MYKRSPLKLFFTLSCLISGIITLHAQDQDATNAFIDQHDSLLNVAYQHLDTAGYNRIFQELKNKISGLKPELQQNYSRSYANAYYNQACLYALLHCKPQALKYLQQSITTGYNNYEHIMSDPDFNGLRNEPQFASIVKPLRETGDYLYILKKGRTYNSKDTRPFPAFTYQANTDTNLASLRRAFNLDSIAAEGSDVSKVLQLLHWVHNLIPHDGNHANPQVRNALSMIAECRQGNRGLNCRGLATVLNECYLSLGFHSRMVTCLPKDSLGIDPDCHVINIVWMPSLNKWIWVDPTNDAYVMNEKGELLSIEEVRQRLTENRPLILNPEANWNHRMSVTKEDYLMHYMAKNLYMLQCAVSSCYDLETASSGKTMEYVTLVPLDYFKQQPARKEITGGNGVNYVYYQINNPDLFWRKP